MYTIKISTEGLSMITEALRFMSTNHSNGDYSAKFHELRGRLMSLEEDPEPDTMQVLATTHSMGGQNEAVLGKWLKPGEFEVNLALKDGSRETLRTPSWFHAFHRYQSWSAKVSARILCPDSAGQNTSKEDLSFDISLD